MKPFDFNVEAIDPVRIVGAAGLAECDLMSPYVWRDGADFSIMLRACPTPLEYAPDTGSIFHGSGRDGLTFRMHRKPAIAPGPDAIDIGGCEDPTVVKRRGKYFVYYTGVEATRTSGQMLYAEGPSIAKLEKKGIAHASSKTEGNTKEATIERTADGRWRLFYEYARDEASLIGLALGADVAGPWEEQPAPFAPRKDRWDSWHLSPGPLLTSDPDMPIMFYNGATRDARWRIGWIAFNRDCTKVVDRCIEPLIVPPPSSDRTGVDIAFAASVVVRGSRAHLYYSLADRSLFRAIIRRS